MTERTSAKIANLGFICAVLVVMIHVVHPVAPKPFSTAVWELTRGGISRIAVPFFFICSGFFLARHFREDGWWTAQVGKRIHTLMIPYCIWITIVFAYKVFLDGVAPWYDVTTFRGFCKVYGLNLFGMPLLGAMWYVRDLMIFTLVSPLLFRLVDRCGALFLCFAFIAYAVLSPGDPPAWMTFPKTMTKFFRSGISLEGLFYFSFGAYVSFRPIALQRRTGLVCGAVAMALVVIRLACVQFHVPMPVCLRTFFIPLLLIGAWELTPTVRWPAFLVTSAFPIYVMHGLVLKTLRHFLVVPHDLLFWMLQVSAAVAIPVAFAWTMRRSAPSVAKLMWGGR